MSDNWIILIPEAPNFVPSEEAQANAMALFRKIAPSADQVKVEVSDHPRFIDCGANLERILCPECRCEIEIDWWQDWLGREAETDFPLAPVVLPCCKAQKTLAQLNYDWPQGVSRFSIEAMNPNIADLSEQQIREFESVLGCRIRKIWQHL